MRLQNMLNTCLAFWKSEPQYAYKRYAYECSPKIDLNHTLQVGSNNFPCYRGF